MENEKLHNEEQNDPDSEALTEEQRAEEKRLAELQKQLDSIHIETPDEKRIRLQREQIEEMIRQGKLGII